jgi:hypothetical protein
MSSRASGRVWRTLAGATALAMLVTGCRGVLKKEYEYEEELYLSLDGSATLYVNASVPALVALRGLDLDVNSRSRVDRNRVRTLFSGAGVDVSRVSWSRRNGRLFLHVRIETRDVRNFSHAAPLAWSSYRFEREAAVFVFRQLVGSSVGHPVGAVGWTGGELVAFRIHVPSKIPFHNAPSHRVERGNILVWEQLLTDRLHGAPVDVQVQMETESILARTLLLFGSTIIAAAATFACVLWWLARRGRDSEVAASRP